MSKLGLGGVVANKPNQNANYRDPREIAGEETLSARLSHYCARSRSVALRMVVVASTSA
jgi:hypothetical protein